MPTIASIKATLPKPTAATYRKGGLKAANLNVKPPAGPKPAYSATTATPPPNPLDSTYFQNVATLNAGTANKIAGYQHQQAAADTGLGATLAGYAHQQPLDTLAAQIAANRTGGLSSDSLAQHLGNLDYGYTRNRAAAQTTHDQAIANLAVQIAAAQNADRTTTDQYRQDAVTRASQAAQSNPAIGLSTIPPVNKQYLAKGAQAPSYVLTPPKGAPAGAKWAGPAKPGANWRGIGGGWWVPTK